jgi:hypothetical protein
MSGSVDEPKDVIWQQRRGRTPSAHENGMGEALGRIFEEGVEDLDGIVQRLNDLGIASADGGKWTAESFQSEIASLGTKEF